VQVYINYLQLLLQLAKLASISTPVRMTKTRKKIKSKKKKGEKEFLCLKYYPFLKMSDYSVLKRIAD